MFNQRNSLEDRHQSIYTLIEKQSLKSPQKVAVIYKQQKLTYKKLISKAEQFASLLINEGVASGTLVGICIDRSIEMVIGLLGILKAGCAYVPLDPTYPKDRLNYMVDDAGIKFIVSERNQYIQFGFKKINIDDSISQNSDNLCEPRNIGAHDLAYVIYTSGSTGKPKGVMIEHISVLNTLLSVGREISIQEGDLFLALTTINFDISVIEIFMPLIFGATCEILSSQLAKDAFKLMAHISNTNPNFMQATPTTWNMLFNIGWTGDKNLCALSGGEALDKNLSNQFLEKSMSLYNLYGPTEATIWSSMSLIKEKDEEISLGQPLANYELVLMKHVGNQIKVIDLNDEAGEIYISGLGLSRGYLNKPMLTAEKFVYLNSSNGKKKFYKTGDLGRYLPNGNIQYIGRVDNQVKLRGYRIELEEIEKSIEENPFVQKAIVVVSQGNDKENAYLSCYLTINSSYLSENYAKISDSIIQTRLQDWQKLWDEIYNSSNKDTHLAELNISGWIDSYSGREIEKEQMLSWLEATCDKIKSIPLKSILEVGAGMGMILFRIAPFCNKYTAIDISSAAINRLNEIIKDKEEYSNVVLYQRSASDIKDLSGIDTIIVNSVAQYFSNADYLLNFIKNCISILPENGSIFIGDIRNKALSKMFYWSVEKSKNQENLTPSYIKDLLQYKEDTEEELLIDPQFFHYIKNIIPEITNISISLKDTTYLNELTLFRYDVILDVDKTLKSKSVDQPEITIDCDSENFNQVELAQELENRNPKYFVVKNLVNSNIASLAQDLLQLHDSDHNIIFQSTQNIKINNCYNPLILIQKFRTFDYSISCSPSLNHPEKFHLIGVRKNKVNHILPQIEIFKNTKDDYRTYTNNPLKKSIDSYILQDIQDQANGKLPEYMMPVKFTKIENFLLTQNGKIDRSKLKNLELKEFKVASNLPKSNIEKALATIWSKFLYIKLESIDCDSNFFELGGNSLQSIQLIFQIKKQLDVLLTIKDIFNNPTISRLGLHIEYILSKQIDNSKANESIEKSNYLEVNISYAQERLWLLDQIGQVGVAYNVPVIFNLKGNLNFNALNHAFNKLIQRHEILRTRFSCKTSDSPKQIVEGLSEVEILTDDLRNITANLQQDKIQEIINQACSKPFNLNKAPLFRIRLINIDNDENILALVFHHIIIDGWSLDIFKEEIEFYYTAFIGNISNYISELSAQYKDYSQWQRKKVVDDYIPNQLKYWRDKLDGFTGFLSLPIDHKRPNIQTYSGGQERFLIESNLAEKIYDLAKKNNITLFMTFLAVFKVLLARYSLADDIVVGTDFSNRNNLQLQKLIGFVSNILPIRSTVDLNKNFTNFLSQIRINCLEAYSNQDLPFSLLVKELQFNRNLSFSPVFQVAFVFENNLHSNLKLPGFVIEEIDIDNKTSKFDLTLFIKETSQGIKGSFEYNTDLFENATIKRAVSHFKILLSSVVDTPFAKLGELEILKEEEISELLFEPNKNNASFLPLTHELFEKQALKTPTATALIHNDKNITYDELNNAANNLAEHLMRIGVREDNLVAICIDPSIEMIVAILAILKAGGAYVPLDTSYPVERLKFMLEDSSADIVLTREKLQNILPLRDKSVFIIDEILKEKNVTKNLDKNLKNTNLAYVMYTSGSTGQPKGIMIQHNSLVNYLNFCRDNYLINSAKNVPLHSSISFDLTVTSIFLPLISGLSITIIDQKKTLDNVVKYLSSGDYQFIKLTPAHLDFFKYTMQERLKDFKGIIVIGGENLLPEQVKMLFENNKELVIINEYGPTEATVGCTVYYINSSNVCNIAAYSAVPIGQAIPNMRIRILDSNKQLVPIGVPGEVYIGGIGLARGYWNNKALTAEKFIKDPWSPGLDSYLYQTGDIAKYLPDKNIIFLGRADEQIKIRGYRIEISEIENSIDQLPGVKQCVVIVKGETVKEKILVAYVIKSQNSALTESDIRISLKKNLQDYMIPAHIIFLNEIPLSPSGKIDKNYLQKLKITKQNSKTSTKNSENITQNIIEEIWKEVLSLKEINKFDNFFDIGGHSLLLAEVHNILQKKLNRQIPLIDLFEYSTIASLSKHLEQSNKELDIALNNVDHIDQRVRNRLKSKRFG